MYAQYISSVSQILRMLVYSVLISRTDAESEIHFLELNMVNGRHKSTGRNLIILIRMMTCIRCHCNDSQFRHFSHSDGAKKAQKRLYELFATSEGWKRSTRWIIYKLLSIWRLARWEMWIISHYLQPAHPSFTKVETAFDFEGILTADIRVY